MDDLLDQKIDVRSRVFLSHPEQNQQSSPDCRMDLFSDRYRGPSDSLYDNSHNPINYPSNTSKVIINAKPTAKPIVPRLVCGP